jgi:predicted DNA-binding transcriptional regulator AlpA
MQKERNVPPAAGWTDSKGAAKHLTLALSSFYQLVQMGKLPSPVKLGNRSRWRIADLDAAMSAMGEEA